MARRDSIKIILLGKTGSGKSALGNNILQKTVFESRLSASRVTRTIRKATSKDRYGRSVVVVDTPDFTCRDRPEGRKTTVLPVPQPHAILFVTSVGEDPHALWESLETLRNQFSDSILQYTLIVFTREYDLRRDVGLSSSEEYIQYLPESLRDLIADCRYMFLDNTAPEEERESKLQELMNKLEEMRKENQPETFDLRTHLLSSRKVFYVED